MICHAFTSAFTFFASMTWLWHSSTRLPRRFLLSKLWDRLACAGKRAVACCCRAWDAQLESKGTENPRRGRKGV